ncbi:avidin/streptavidin family protein [Pseudomonas trivialis]|uniref:avidin/streptavidin family protein n=1 Tax=Pseudomonas trivialis TaxID=200450 RepID=UPI0030CBF0EF
MNTCLPGKRLVFPMQRGPFQNNGATPWYSTIALGTPGQPLKLAIDSGTNITWVTSTLCPPDQCTHFGTGRFDYRASSSFTFTDCLQRPYSFGPWGTMQIESASDVLNTPTGATLPMKLFLATGYGGAQFKQLDWDGGIGLPCSSAYVEGRSSFLFQELLRSGQLDPTHPYVAFDWNANDREGTCQMGAIDESKTHGPHVFLPWSVYSKVPGVEYIWSADLKSYSVGDETLATDVTFALDSGSSQFKGDDRIMQQTLARIARGGSPAVVLGFAEGEITLGAQLYNVLIEEGPDKGKTLPQFAPLGLADLVLVGSLVMEHCYTVHEYQVVKCGHEVYSLAPVGIWLFNRPDGPQIITRSSSRRFIAGARSVATGKVTLPARAVQPLRSTSVAGTWKNDYGSVMTLTVTGNQISGIYQSSTGSTGQYAVTGYQSSSAAASNQGRPVALAIDWHSLGNEPADPSWNWTSGLCGQISLVEHEEVLELSHLLVASSDFPGLAQQGTYVDKLRYRRCSPGVTERQDANSFLQAKIDNPLTGRWMTPDANVLTLTVEAQSKGRLGRVTGKLSGPAGAMEVSGFTDICAVESGLTLQSTAITAAQETGVLSLCGTLDLKSDVLELSILTCTPTAPTLTYVQTRLSSATFKRIGVYQ